MYKFTFQSHQKGGGGKPSNMMYNEILRKGAFFRLEKVASVSESDPSAGV